MDRNNGTGAGPGLTPRRAAEHRVGARAGHHGVTVTQAAGQDALIPAAAVLNSALGVEKSYEHRR